MCANELLRVSETWSKCECSNLSQIRFERQKHEYELDDDC